MSNNGIKSDAGDNAADSSDKSRTVLLVSQEGESYEVPIAEAIMSELVKTMVDGTQYLVLNKHDRNINLYRGAGRG